MKLPVVEPDTFVEIAYRVFEAEQPPPIDLPPNGDDPACQRLGFVWGYGLVMPALERGLAGKASGTRFALHAEPSEAYGEFEQEGVFEVDKEGFDGWEGLAVGDEFVAENADGRMLMRLVEVREDCLLVDTNHPLAGKKLRLEVEMLTVRPATEAEIASAQSEAEELGRGLYGEVDSPTPAETGESSPLIQLGKKNSPSRPTALKQTPKPHQRSGRKRSKKKAT